MEISLSMDTRWLPPATIFVFLPSIDSRMTPLRPGFNTLKRPGLPETVAISLNAVMNMCVYVMANILNPLLPSIFLIKFLDIFFNKSRQLFLALFFFGRGNKELRGFFKNFLHGCNELVHIVLHLTLGKFVGLGKNQNHRHPLVPAPMNKFNVDFLGFQPTVYQYKGGQQVFPVCQVALDHFLPICP